MHIQIPYQVFGKEISKFAVSGVSNLGQAHILKHLQTPYKVFGKEISKFAMSGGVQFSSSAHPKASNTVQP